MSRNFTQAGRRLSFLATRAHSAGDLVWFNGFFGVVQDDVASGALGTLILEGVWKLGNPREGLVVQGAKIYAPATTVVAAGSQASSLSVAPSSAASNPTTWTPIGRAIATSPASSATSTINVQLFNPNAY